jgi:hypothetical protein
MTNRENILYGAAKNLGLHASRARTLWMPLTRELRKHDCSSPSPWYLKFDLVYDCLCRRWIKCCIITAPGPSSISSLYVAGMYSLHMQPDRGEGVESKPQQKKPLFPSQCATYSHKIGCGVYRQSRGARTQEPRMPNPDHSIFLIVLDVPYFSQQQHL